MALLQAGTAASWHCFSSAVLKPAEIPPWLHAAHRRHQVWAANLCSPVKATGRNEDEVWKGCAVGKTEEGLGCLWEEAQNSLLEFAAFLPESSHIF